MVLSFPLYQSLLHSKLNFTKMENYHQAMKVLTDLHIRRNDKLIERSVSKH